jgi:dolichol-phosphate mannosyltransferase
MMTKNHSEIKEYENSYPHSSISKEDLTIVVPVLNEEKGIGIVIEKIKNEGYNNILVIDGYSTDKTVDEALKNGVNVVFQHDIGKTGAIKTAIDNVETPYFIVMDGDCTYDPKDIINFIPHIASYDEIIGTRTFGRRNIPFLNRFGNVVINTFFNFLFGTNLIDVCSGMYALQTTFSKLLAFNTQGFDVEVEIAAQTALSGRITQVPINYLERVGQQKLQPWKHGFQIMSTIWKLALYYNPVFLFSILGSFLIFPAILILLWFYFNLLQGIYYFGWALIGVLLLIIGFISINMAVFSLLIKRMEKRLIDKILLKNE